MKSILCTLEFAHAIDALIDFSDSDVSKLDNSMDDLEEHAIAKRRQCQQG